MHKKNQTMKENQQRGSDKLLAAWKSRTISEDAMREIVAALEKSPARVDRAEVIGGAAPTGVSVSLSYDGDDGPWCGNDILFWLRWHRVHGGVVRPPRILINGTPFPDLIRVDLDFGHVPERGPAVLPSGSGPAGLGAIGQ